MCSFKIWRWPGLWTRVLFDCWKRPLCQRFHKCVLARFEHVKMTSLWRNSIILLSWNGLFQFKQNLKENNFAFPGVIEAGGCLKVAVLRDFGFIFMGRYLLWNQKMCVLFEIKDSLIFRKFKQSDWLLQVTRLLLTNQSALFQRGIALILYSKICLWHRLTIWFLTKRFFQRKSWSRRNF